MEDILPYLVTAIVTEAAAIGALFGLWKNDQGKLEKKLEAWLEKCAKCRASYEEESTRRENELHSVIEQKNKDLVDLLKKLADLANGGTP